MKQTSSVRYSSPEGYRYCVDRDSSIVLILPDDDARVNWLDPGFVSTGSTGCSDVVCVRESDWPLMRGAFPAERHGRLHTRASMLKYARVPENAARARIKAGTFPPGFKIGASQLGWFEHELDAIKAARGATDAELAHLVDEIVQARRQPVRLDTTPPKGSPS